MRLFHQYEYRLTKPERNTGALFQRVREAVRSVRGDEQPIRFYLSDESHASVSPCARVLKRFPGLARYSADELVRGSGTLTVPILTNLTGAWEQADPNGEFGLADADILGAIAEGIPRRYPFWRAAFVFDEIDWSGSGEPVAPPASPMGPRGQFPNTPAPHPASCLRPSVTLLSDWGGSGRDLYLVATVEVDPPPRDAEELPPLPAGVAEPLDRLGKRHLSSPCAAPSPEEAATLAEAYPNGYEIVTAIRKTTDGDMTGIDLPHKLPPEARRVVDAPSVTAKKPLTAALRPIGYKRNTKLSGRGASTYKKRMPSHNEATLSFDMGPMSQAMSAMMTYAGPMWRHTVTFRFTPHQAHSRMDINSQETMDKVAENAAAVVKYLEAEFIPPLDALYGPAPAWLEYTG